MIVYAAKESLSGEMNRQSGFTGGSRNKMSDLQLYIPHPEDGWFYVKMMSDPATMAYNAPWFPPDGCIPEPEAEWLDLQADWIGKAPERFYAFLQRKSDGVFVGDVNYHSSPEQDWCDMGIVIYAPERGKGYGRQGLSLLLERAFKTDGVACLHNDFETTRDAAYRIHKAVGFRDAGTVDGIVHLELTREEYLENNK
jgi:RimJ/RimL family protein N-acetyltransferase